MSEKPQTRPRRAMPWQRRRNRLLYAILILIGAPLLTWLVTKAYWSGQVRELEGQIAALGYEASPDEFHPVTPEDLKDVKSPLVDARELLLPITQEEREFLPDVGQLANDLTRPSLDFTKEIERIRSILARNEPAFDAFIEALHDPAAWPDLPPEELRLFRNRVMEEIFAYYRLKLAMALNDGNAGILLQGLTVSCQLLAGDLQRLPSSWGTRTMERAIQPLLLPVLKDPALTSADLAPVAAALASIDVSAVLQQEQRRIVNSLLSYRWRRYFGPAIVPLSVLGLYDYQAYHQLTLLKAAAGTFAEPPASWWRAIEPLCARAHAEEGNPLTSFIPGETARVLAQQLVSALQGVTLADALKCVVAIERYRRDQGAMPESLDALVPQYLDAVPVDYIGGGPLSFAVEGSGYRVRSAGVEPPARGTAPRRHFLRHAPELWGFEIAG